MSESRGFRLAWGFVAAAAVSGVLLFSGAASLAGDDHDAVRELRTRGDVLSLTEVLAHPSLAGQKVLEAELEREHGQLVYELELLDDGGRVRKRYFDAVNGQPLNGYRGD